MSDEEIAEYALELRELKVNSKPIITSLTMLAARLADRTPPPRTPSPASSRSGFEPPNPS